jgi:hypothetical protein
LDDVRNAAKNPGREHAMPSDAKMHANNDTPPPNRLLAKKEKIVIMWYSVAAKVSTHCATA